MRRKLIFLDIDGTLTMPGHPVPPDSALRAIRAARDNGHKVFLCTGRSRAMLAPVLACGFDGAVASGGGYIFIGDRVLFDCPMPRSLLDTALRLLGGNGVFRTIEGRDTSWDDEDAGAFLSLPDEGNSEFRRWRKAMAEKKQLCPLREYDGSPIYKILFMCRDISQIGPARMALEAEFNFVIQDDGPLGCVNGEMVNRRFDKGRGVRMVADDLGFSLADTIGFGDSMNDLELIQTVGTGVCMENGSPRLKKHSGMICPAVDRDGIALAFEQLGLV